MTAHRLSYGVSGARVYAAIAEAARQAGVGLTTYVRPLWSNPYAALEQLKRAAQPKPGTIVRVNALIAGEEIPAPPANLRQAERAAAAARPSVLAGMVPTSAPVARDPCWYCGVRGDIGCSCRPRA